MPSKQQALIATIAFHGIALALLFVLTIVSTPPRKPAGVAVNFGYIDDGSGDIDPEPMEVAPQELPDQAVAARRKTPQIKDNSDKPAPKVLTQENPDAPAVKKQTQEEIDAAKKLAEEREIKRLEELERQRIEKERLRLEEIERQRIAEEQRKQAEQQAQVNAIKGRMGKSFGGQTGNSGSQGEGVTGKAGNQGDPTGSVDASKRGTGGGTGTGISYSLEGRNVIGSLTKPEYNINDYGTVVVQITVNKEGAVTVATPGVKGSTTMDSRLLEAAKKAALTARFNRVTSPEAPTYQRGTITYHFKLL
ncbi:MAG: TonB family protein [Bacteroidota bacterium]